MLSSNLLWVYAPNEMSWERRWRDNHTPWDAGASPPTLLDLVERRVLPEGRALVPGCGRGYDVLTLARSGWDTTGLEIAETAIARFEQLRASEAALEPRARVLEADFFEFEPDRPFDVGWDYTFLCALGPEQRDAWVKAWARLLGPGAELAALIFPVNPSSPRDQGPPYPLDPDEVAALLDPFFTRLELVPAERSHPARAGREWVGRFQRRTEPLA